MGNTCFAAQFAAGKRGLVRELFELFTTFALIGSMTFGGGYAMLPILSREIVEKRHWANEEELLDYFAIGQCTPGIIAINTATFIGVRRRGVKGAIAATLGMIAPSLIIIVLIAMFLSNFMELAWIQHAFSGVRIAVCALIASTVVKLFKRNSNTWLKVLFTLLAFISVAIVGLSPILPTVFFAVLGVFMFKGRLTA